MKTFAIVLLFSLLVGGCTAVPTVEFASYKKAYDDVKSESEKLLVELDAVFQLEAEINSKKEQQKKNPAPNYPFPLSSVTMDRSEPGAKDVQARRLTLDLISQFNTLLSVLAAGRSPQEVQASAKGLIGGLNELGVLAGVGGGSLIPFGNEAASLLGTILVKIEAAQNREQFIKAIRAGAPLMANVFIQLQKDADEIYRIRALDARRRYVDLRFGMLKKIDQMQSVLNPVTKPSATNKGAFEEIQKQILAIADNANLKSVASFKTDGPDTLSPLILSQLEQTLDQLHTSEKDYQAVIKEANAFHNWVQSYKSMVIKASIKFHTVILALDKPVDLTVIARDLSGFIFQVKLDFQALQTARAAAAGA